MLSTFFFGRLPKFCRLFKEKTIIPHIPKNTTNTEKIKALSGILILSAAQKDYHFTKEDMKNCPRFDSKETRIADLRQWKIFVKFLSITAKNTTDLPVT